MLRLRFHLTGTRDQGQESERTLNGTNIDRCLENWGRVHAAVMLGAIGFADVTGNLNSIVSLALISFACLVLLCRSNWSPSGKFGWANSVTALRLMLVLYTAYGLRGAS